MYQFRDPIHGFIEISEDELKIIDAPPFQRLRNIRQLATTYLVYHGAEHTRFGHSLGVMHLVSRTFDSVVKKAPNLFSDNNNENAIKTRWYRQILRIIGLTHDLGHAPFSHASEDLFEDGKRHEDFTKKIICESEISTYINKIGKQFQEENGEQYKISPELIWMIYDGKDVTNEKFIMPDFMFLKSFVDGELDCDKMDYLLRDSLYCGVSYGKYDLDRFISTLTAHKEEGRIQLAIEKGGVQAFEEFVLARYFMFIQVYFHKTRRYMDRALVECLKTILPKGKYPEEMDSYLLWDDTRVLRSIAQSENKTAIAYKNRKVMTCVFESKAHAESSDTMGAKIIFHNLNEMYGDKVLFDSVDKAAHKLLPMLYAQNDDSGRGIMIFDEKTHSIQNIMEVSVILASIVKPISIKRIYADKDIAADVIQSIKKLLSA